MATSRTTGGEDGVDDSQSLSESQFQSQHYHPPFKYSQMFSNKLIDLAISVDAEAAENQRQTALAATSSTLGEVEADKTPVSTFTFANAVPYANQDEDDEDDYEDEDELSRGEERAVVTFLQNGKSMGSSQSRVDESSGSGHNSIMSERNLSEAQEGSKREVPGNRSAGLQRGSGVLTVFSSPCREYFPSSKISNHTELPEYVQMMMEKDLALKRLVKTGSVTISQVQEEARSEDEEKYLGDEDYLYDDYALEEKSQEELLKPFAPLGNIDDWDAYKYPYAKRLLELAHMSISVSSSNASSPSRSENTTVSTGEIKTKKTTSKKPQLTTTTTNDKKITSTLPKSSSGGPRITPSPKRSFKTEPQQQLSVKNFPIPNNHSRLSLSPTGVTTSQNGKTVDNSKTNRRQRNRKAITSIHNSGSDGEDPLSSFLQVDPTKFLEVSLQEGKLESKSIPDDSHRRKYKCNFCEKKFCWSTDLKRHTLIHTGERPFQCTECPANFTRKFLMQKHLKKVHQTPSGQIINHRARKPISVGGSSFLQLPPPSNPTDEDESQSLDGLVAKCKALPFRKMDFKDDEPVVPDDDEDCFEDYEMEEGRSDENEEGLDLPRKFKTNGYSTDGRRTNNVTYLDF